jgi:hypothetical protein
MSTPPDLVLEHFPKHRKAGAQKWSARCPAHDDKNPSLSIGVGMDGRVLIRCQAGCATEDVLAKAGLSWSDLHHKNGDGRGSEIVAEYDYTDEKGSPLYQRCRTIPKSFFYRLPNGETGRGGIAPVLYHLQQLTQAPKGQLVVVAEGEKDVHTVEKMGFTATTSG